MEVKENYKIKPQPKPDGGKVEIWPLVIQDILQSSRHIRLSIINDVIAKIKAGIKKYETSLHSHNGRDPLLDAYQESIDLLFYLKQYDVENETDGRFLINYQKSVETMFYLAEIIEDRDGNE